MTDFFKTVSISELTTQHTMEPLDVLVRVSRETASKVTSIASMDTQLFVAKLHNVQREWKLDVSALNELVEWQHKIIDFNSSYSAYLLEQIDEEEFELIAEQMATEEQEVNPSDLASAMARILRLTTIDYSPSDFANMFNCSSEAIDAALHMIPSPLLDIHPALREVEQ